MVSAVTQTQIINPQLEREAISRALLDATAGLAQSQDAETILRAVCDALVSASPHIRLAWMYVGDPDAEVIRPSYAAGPARAYALSLALTRDPLNLQGPTRHSLATSVAVVSCVRGSSTFAPWRAQALLQGLEQSASFPFGKNGNPVRGAVCIYADQPDYFDKVGLGPFLAFAHVGEVALEQAALRSRLQDLATLDRLTGIPNRGALQEVLEREHARAYRSNRPYTLLLFDLDRFKLINDNYGHGVGDQVLVEVTHLAKEALRDGDWLGRWGGEEFLCMLPETDHHEAALVADRLLHRIAEHPLWMKGRHFQVSVSIGLAGYPHDGDDLDAILTGADAALYAAKRGGRGRVAQKSDGAGIFFIGNQIEEALRCEWLRPAYQPIVELANGRPVAEEALARIEIPGGGPLLEAASFIESATRLQLAHRIDYQIVRQTMRRCRAHLEAGVDILTFVNVSSDLLRHPALIQNLLDYAKHYCGTCPESDDAQGCASAAGGRMPGAAKPLVIEITEREFLDNTQEARRILAPLLDFGFQLAVDDFGSGYSSFQYLADLPIAFLKIEGSLVHRAAKEDRIQSIIRGIQDIAGELGLITLAECVEDEATAEVLREIGVDWAQGYYFGRPALAQMAVAG